MLSIAQTVGHKRFFL